MHGESRACRRSKACLACAAAVSGTQGVNADLRVLLQRVCKGPVSCCLRHSSKRGAHRLRGPCGFHRDDQDVRLRWLGLC